MAFHDLVLSLDGRGGWEIQRGQRARRSAGAQTGAPAPADSSVPKRPTLSHKHGEYLGLDVVSTR
jgi:hypothetical protein